VPNSYLDAVRLAVAETRFDAYDTGGTKQIEILARYLWNIALAESLFPSLHILEVALRNSLHAALVTETGSETWYDDNNLLVDPWAQGEVLKAHERLKKTGKPDEPGRILASLELGFWTSLLHHQYEQGPTRPATQVPIWPKLIPTAFPHAKGVGATRQYMWGVLSGLRDFRNRVFHYEPIWKGRKTYSGSLVQLPRDHAEIVQVVSWLSPELATTLRLMDRFSPIHTKGTTPYLAMALAHCIENKEPY
jgi:hypothetical protein